MKKIIIRVSNNIFDCCAPLACMVERFEVISFFNFTANTYTDVCNITLKDGMSLEGIKSDFITNLLVIMNEGRNYTCLMKGTISKEISKFISQFDLKLEYPILFDGITYQFGVVGSSEELSNIIKTAKEMGWKFEILSIQEYDPLAINAFSNLTTKQKEILLHAYNNGYFDHPRKINASQLAKKIGIHKTTFLEHLHKAEKRLIGGLLGQTS